MKRRISGVNLECDLCSFMHLDPIYDMEQVKRYEQVKDLINQVNNISKLLTQYTTAGNNMCKAMNDVHSKLQEIEIISLNNSYRTLMSTMTTMHAAFISHFEQIEESITKPMKLFVKKDIEDLASFYKDNNQALDKYGQAQEKFMSLPKNSRLKSLRHKHDLMTESHHQATISFYRYVRHMDLTEAQISALLANMLISYSNSAYTSFQPAIAQIEQNNELIRDSQSDILCSAVDVQNLKKSIDNDQKTLETMIPALWARLNSQYIQGGQDNAKQGYLWKLTGKVNKTWEKLFFNCSNGNLSSSPSAETALNPTWTLPLLYCHVKAFEDLDRTNCFQIITKDRSIILQAPSLWDHGHWISVIQNGISSRINSHGSLDLPKFTPVNQTPEFIGNICADCGEKGATWLLMNGGGTVCDQCVGVHRSLTVKVSKVRSLVLDTIDCYHLELHKRIGTEKLNKILEAKVGKSKIQRNAAYEARYEFITNKYVKKLYIDRSLPPADPMEAIQNQDLLLMIRAIYEDRLEKNYKHDFTPLHAAACVGNPLIVLLLAQNTNFIFKNDDKGWSPLSYATFYKHRAVVEVLLKLGSMPSDSPEANAYGIAKYVNDFGIIDILEKFANGATIADSYAPPYTYFVPQEVDLSWIGNYNNIQPPKPEMSLEEQKRLAMTIRQMGKHKRRMTTVPTVNISQMRVSEFNDSDF